MKIEDYIPTLTIHVFKDERTSYVKIKTIKASVTSFVHYNVFLLNNGGIYFTY